MIEFVRGKRDEGVMIIVQDGTERKLSSAELDELLKDHDLTPTWSATGELYFTLKPKEKASK